MSIPHDTALAWQSLETHANALKPRHLRELFARHPTRFEDFSLTAGDLLIDFSKQRVTPETLLYLRDLARAARIDDWRQKMAAGDPINHTENRPALHMALRFPYGAAEQTAKAPTFPPRVGEEVARNLVRMRDFCETVHNRQWRGMSDSPITDVVNLGIGGSDLGPRMAVRALTAFAHPDLKTHFVANMDGADLAPLLARLNPRSTLFVVVSKSFATEETLQNARAARDWLATCLPEALSEPQKTAALARHFAAVTSHIEDAHSFGVPSEQIFAFGDWVGGRFSLWSPAGLSLALAVGFSHFERMLSGARLMDEHFFHAPLEENLPITLALLDIWNVNGIGVSSHGIFPYSQSLEFLPAYLQQLEMESNGKSVDREGRVLMRKSCPILWGSPGTIGQHSFFQLLHQGGQIVPCDFILVKRADFPLADHHARLLANGLAQSAALAFGQTREEARAAGLPEALLPYRAFPGNQPSTTILMENLSPRALGQLLALYEHKVFTESVLWNINAFDQWGVELGKQMARTLLPSLSDAAMDAPNAAAEEKLDASTRGLLRALRR
ncbi:MAG: glucose-6-phosphate isomerase [Zoogloeaceae bacterium]|jgi:glucose-6-phosphate isomerase|nr:glucose-6-phosphate isomerase [Zoogloeaceae bacterium]